MPVDILGRQRRLKLLDMTTTSKFLIIAGVLLVSAGLLLAFLQRLGVNPLGWLGRLPGDVRLEGERSRFYFPFATSLLISLLVTGILWLFRR